MSQYLSLRETTEELLGSFPEDMSRLVQLFYLSISDRNRCLKYFSITLNISH